MNPPEYADMRAMQSDPEVRPIGSGLAPFAVAAVLAWLAVPIGSSVDWSQYALSLALLALSGAMAVVRIAGRRGWGLGTVANSFVFLAAVAALRNSAGGINSAVGILSLIPVFHTALYSRSRRELYLVLAGVACFYLIPIVAIGGAHYPPTQYRGAGLFVMISSIIGVATQRLVASVRQQAGESASRERMLEQVAITVRGLLQSSHARADVCQAAQTIGDATMAILFEPVPETGALRSTAMCGVVTPQIEIAPQKASALNDAFVSGRSHLVTENVEETVASHVLWTSSGQPESVLYQPLLRAGQPVGVLVVGWRGAIPVDRARTTVVELLAHEAATVIDRADALNELTDMAQTDPLTGLPNRRAWDLGIRDAVAANRSLAIAMLDFDHFKQFNDIHGHPAGDRLLKETSAAWRDQLRPTDLLARVGGEEFGLMLPDTDHETASRVIARLRACVTNGRTCSAGIAVRRPRESCESVIARADAALYDAKGSGRDRACLSV